MLSLEIIPHQNITSEELSEIIQIKTTAWDYDYDSQVKWIKENLKATDLHVFLVDKQEKLAYLNLQAIEININGKITPCLGIGNVVSKRKGEGLGRILMDKVKGFLLKENTLGLLFCKSSLVGFYERSSWKVISKEKLNIPKLDLVDATIYTMIFNHNNKVKELIYTNNLF